MKDEHDFFLSVARLFESRSTCSRVQVGAILVKDGRIISTGYNGVLPGAKHCNEMHFATVDWAHTALDSDVSKEHHAFSSVNELHAEQNVIAFAARNGVCTDGCTLYTTLAPCPDCSKLIAAAGIKAVYYLQEYDRCGSGIEFLKKNGIPTWKIENKTENHDLDWIRLKKELLTSKETP